MNENICWYVVIGKDNEVIVYQWHMGYSALIPYLDSPQVHGKDNWRLFYFSDDEMIAKAKAYDAIEVIRLVGYLNTQPIPPTGGEGENNQA